MKFDMKISIAFALALMLATSATAFKTKLVGRYGVPIHENITREALNSIKVFFSDGTIGTVRQQFINDLVEENTENDEKGINEGTMHFDDSLLVASAEQVWFSKRAAIAAYGRGNFPTVDGYAVQTNLGSAMHTVQDFFAHSTWAELNAHLQASGKDSLPLPRLGLTKAPFSDFEFTGANGVAVLNDSPNDTTNDNVPATCSDSAFDASQLRLSTAYYDFGMSELADGQQSSLDRGWATDGWNGFFKTALVGSGAVEAPVRYSTSQTINWPLGRCVHGGDGDRASGINKDAGGRPHYAEARAAAVKATRTFMLDFLATSGATELRNKSITCSYILDCTAPGAARLSGDVAVLDTGRTSSARGGMHKVFSVGPIAGLSEHLSLMFDGSPCLLKLESESPEFVCPDAHAGPGQLSIYQTAVPSYELYSKAMTVRAESTQFITNTVVVQATSYPGPAFVNPISAAATCTITATGSWTNGGGTLFKDANGYVGTQCGTGCRSPLAPSHSLLLVHSVNGVESAQFIGTTGTASLAAGETVYLSTNDAVFPYQGQPNAYFDNSGSQSVTLSCRAS